MATIRTIVKSNTNPMTIYLRFKGGRRLDITKSSNILVSQEDWNKIKNEPKRTTAHGKQLKVMLDRLKTSLLERYNTAVIEGENVNGDWLTKHIADIQKKTINDELEKSFLLNYIQSYIDYLPNHIQANGKRGVSKNTIQKFVTLKNRVTDFQKSKRQTYVISDVSTEFMQNFDSFLKKNGYSDNYIGTLSTGLKTVCKHARTNGLKVSSTIDNIKAVKEDTKPIILNFDELEIIRNTTYGREALNNARDWLLIGCYIGQRVSDLLRLTSDNIGSKGGLLMLELTQQKTGKKIVLPVQDEVKRILDKRKGQFPYKISDVKFNLYIKDVCKLAGITELISGSKIITEKTKEGIPNKVRKVKGIYPKYELITSHVCRRSFATNYYGDIPTPLIMSATGHATEKMFLRYIGKSATDQAQQLAEYYAKLASERKKEPVMNVLKSAE